MKAIRFHELGGPEVLRLEEAEEPRPGDGEVLIRVRAAGMNFADTMTTQGRYYLRPRFPQIPGLEVAGEVLEVGAGVGGPSPGDRVMAVLPNGGGYAEKCVARAEHVTPIPSGLDFAEAAALPVQAVTADQVLQVAGRVQPGEMGPRAFRRRPHRQLSGTDGKACERSRRGHGRLERAARDGGGPRRRRPRRLLAGRLAR